jgi:CheY-like chemotaxis protein
MKEVKTVFVVDDDKNQATMVADHLGKFKHLTIKTFSSGEECLQNMTLDPQIIFLDYNFDKAGAGAMNGGFAFCSFVNPVLLYSRNWKKSPTNFDNVIRLYKKNTYIY